MNFLSKIWSTGNFIPHGHCYLWQPELVWLHILSDGLIALAYFSIPIALFYFITQRKDLPYPEIFVLFSAFIVACGLTHSMSIWTLWHPTYWLSGFIKAITAGVSVSTAATLAPLMPKLLAFSRSLQIEEMNQKLKAEIRERQQIQEALQASEKRLKKALQQLNFHVENTPLGVIEWDNEFRLQRWSKQAEKIFGWQTYEVIGLKVNDWEFIFPEDVERVGSIIQQLQQGNIPRNTSVNRNYTKEGKVINCEWYHSAFFDEKGNLISILSLVLDVTERIKAQIELQLSQQKLQLIINTIPQSIFWKNKDLIYQGCNYSFANRAGFKSPTEIVGKTDCDLPGNQEHVESYSKIDRQVIESNTPIYQIIEPQLTIQGKQRWLQTSKVPIHNQDGKVIGILGSYEDITERIEAQQKLDRQQQTLRAILDNAPIWILMTDVNGKVKFVNNTLCENIGIPESRFLEVEQYHQLFPEKEAANLYRSDANCWVSNLPSQSEETFRFIDGKQHNLKVIKVKIQDDNNQVFGLMSLGLDITESKQAQQKLQESEAKFRQIARHEELLNHLANQIRNSLNIDTILDTTVHQVRNILKVDRCIFIWHIFAKSTNVEVTNNNYLDSWEVVNESKEENFPSLLDKYTIEQVGYWALGFLQLEIIRVNDISLVDDRKMRHFILALGIISFVSIPIQTKSGKIGILVCAHHTSVHNWDDSEVKLLKGVTDQLAIAIDQAELYNQSREATFQARSQAQELSEALKKLQQAQAQLIQTEKMSSLGQMVAGIAHEINNPINFISGNIVHVSKYTQDLLSLIALYQENYLDPPTAIQEEIETIELDFLIEDLPKILNSIKVGANRIADIVISLRNFSRLDESEVKFVDIHEGIESTLLILQNKLKYKPQEKAIQIIKNYDYLPKVECYVSQINQVFMNIISNAIDALAEKRSQKFNPNGMNQNSDIPENLPTITISTKVISSQEVRIIISDNGMGMKETVRNKIFDPFFTTKPIGSGTGLGLSISYQIIVEKHQGKLDCISTVGQGTKFIIEIPLQQKAKEIIKV